MDLEVKCQLSNYVRGDGWIYLTKYSVSNLAKQKRPKTVIFQLQTHNLQLCNYATHKQQLVP